jgi:hypothetical protein
MTGSNRCNTKGWWNEVQINLLGLVLEDVVVLFVNFQLGVELDQKLSVLINLVKSRLSYNLDMDLLRHPVFQLFLIIDHCLGLAIECNKIQKGLG